MTAAHHFPWLAELAGTVVSIASGPSLTDEDCERVRASGLATIVTNLTFRRCLWATALVAHDEPWWRIYHKEVAANFKGRKVTCQANGRKYGAESLLHVGFQPFRLSGAASISLAVLAGAKRVVLLGHDAQKSADGRVHWHNDYRVGLLGNSGSMPRWPDRMTACAEYARAAGCEVVNASRETALTMFPRVSLEEALA